MAISLVVLSTQRYGLEGTQLGSVVVLPTPAPAPTQTGKRARQETRHNLSVAWIGSAAAADGPVAFLLSLCLSGPWCWVTTKG